MSKTVRNTTQNVNQFAHVDHQQADLIVRMRDSDVIGTQETVFLDLKTFAARHGWNSYQVRLGDNDGHANTGVIWRAELGEAEDTASVFLGDVDNTRARYLTAVKLGGVWYGSVHIFPKRDSKGIPAQVSNLGKWVRTLDGAPVVLDLDKNQCPASLLERSTGLKWHAPANSIDGFLTNLKVRSMSVYPKGYSDHPGVKAVIVLPKEPAVSRIKRALVLLKKALTYSKAHGQTKKADRIRKAQDALAKKAAPPRPEPTPHGFMPGAIRKPIPAGSSDPAITPVGVIQHIAVSNATSLHDLFSNDGGIESHFYILKDGTIEQYRSIYYEADAQFAGNSFGSPRKGFVSVEHQGGVGADLNVPMPKAQLDAFHRVISWVHKETGFPLRVCPAWDQAGVGYHCLFDQWNTNHHSCPGAARIKQFHDVTVPWLAAGGK